MAFHLETARLRLRPMTFDDADHLARIFLDPVAMQHYPSLIDRPGTLEWIERQTTNYNKYGHGFWIVELKADGQFLGQCGLIPQRVADAVEPEVAYLFVREHWGHG
ncbi:MAG: GNAT family N-acetyltransferase [Clostridia bacterium]